MTKTKKITLGILAFLSVCCFIMSFGAVSAKAEITEASKFETEGTPWQYEETVARPTGKITYGGESKDASVALIFPDGRISEGKGDLITLNAEGVYTVEYSAIFNGNTIKEQDTFTVKKDLFYTSSNASSAKYYNYVYREHATEEYASERESVLESSVSGIYVSLVPGDEFRYSRVLNLQGLTAQDIIVKIVMAPERIGIKDVSDFTVTLTDAYDPANFITIKTSSNTVTPLVYTSACASNGQQFTGWEYNRNVKHVNNAYGTPMRFSFTGPCKVTESTTAFTTSKSHNDVKFGIDTIAKNAFSISMDYAELQAFNITSKHSGSTAMIVDFNDPEHFEKIWNGFTTGECFLSVKGGTYLGETFNFMITDLLGLGNLCDADGDRVEEIFSFEDRGTLDINVDSGVYDENDLPLAEVNKEYPVFTASTLNQYYGKINAEYTIYKGNETVVNNGEKFIPQEAGEYKLVYTVKDNFLTENQKTLKIVAVEKASAVKFSLEGLDAIAETEETETTGVAGKTVKLASAVNLSGGVADGILDINTTVELNGKSFEINDGTFFPTLSGDYTVTVTATDYIGNRFIKTYEIPVVSGDIPVYVEKPNLPKYFISGRSYTLPTVFAHNYTDGSGKAVATKIAYIDGEGIKKAIGKTIVPVSNAVKDTVDIIYYTDAINAANDFSGNLVFKNLPIVEVTSDISGRTAINYAGLLVSDGITVTPESSFTSLKTTKNSEVNFINALGTNGLTVRFQGVKGASGYSAFTITMTDSENASQKVKFYYITGDSSLTYFKINSLTSTEYKAAQAITEGDVLAIELNTTINAVKFDRNSSSYITIPTYFDGKEFDGFKSGKVYIDFGFEGVKGNSEIDIISIAGQRISNQTTDRIAPGISIDGEYLGYVEFGEYIRIPKATITDVVDPSVSGTVTVETPENADGTRRIAKGVDGSYLKDADVDRDYYVKAEKYGAYLVTFYAKDFSGNALNYQYYINVVDGENPTLIVKDPVTTGKVGQNITVAKPTVYDNLSDVSVTIFVWSPSGTVYELPEGKYTFNTGAKGVYRIMYVAKDEAKNYTIKVFNLTVTD